MVHTEGLTDLEQRLLRPNEVQGSAIDLEEVDTNLFVAPEANLWQPAGGVGVFGGQVLGQALHAATLTTMDVKGNGKGNGNGNGIGKGKGNGGGGAEDDDEAFECHSLHAYFLRAGDASRPIVHRVKRTRDGRSFLARSVESTQRGRVIFKLSASFHRPEPDKGINHQPAMPEVPPPEECIAFDYEAMVRRILEKNSRSGTGGGAEEEKGGGGGVETSLSRAKQQVLRSISRAVPMDIRWVGKEPADRTPRPARQLAWMKVARGIGDDVPSNLHRCVGVSH
jgi:acyl-CoA thioesterase